MILIYLYLKYEITNFDIISTFFIRVKIYGFLWFFNQKSMVKIHSKHWCNDSSIFKGSNTIRNKSEKSHISTQLLNIVSSDQ